LHGLATIDGHMPCSVQPVLGRETSRDVESKQDRPARVCQRSPPRCGGKCSRDDRPAARPLLGLHRLSPRGEGAARSSYARWAGPRDSDGLNPSLLNRLQTKYLQLARSFLESNCKRKEPLRLRCFRYAGLPTWKGGPDSAQPLPDTGPYREGPTRPVPCGH
jgi:hypothetical protein